MLTEYDTIIQLLQEQNDLLTLQTNTTLFLVGSLSALGVLLLLYKAIKSFY